MKVKGKSVVSIIDNLGMCFFDGTYSNKQKKGTNDITFLDYVDSVRNPDEKYLKQVELIRRVKKSKNISEARKLVVSAKILGSHTTKDSIYKALKWKSMHVYPSCQFDKEGCKYENVTLVNGLMVFDIQGVDKEIHSMLLTWKHTVALHKSIGGDTGDYALFLYCPGVTVDSYSSMWDKGDKLIQETFGLTPENSDMTKDVTRIRYLSYDPDIYYNSFAEPILVTDIVVSTSFTKEQRKSINEALNSEPNWHKFGVALAVSKGESGRTLWHEFSSINKSKYNHSEADKKYDRLLGSITKERAGGITEATLFYMLQDMKVDYILPRTNGTRIVKDGKAEKISVESVLEFLNATWVRNEISDKLINFQTGRDVNVESIWTEFQLTFNEPSIRIGDVQNLLRSERMNTINPIKNFFNEAEKLYMEKPNKYVDKFISTLPAKDKRAAELFIKTWCVHAYLQAVEPGWTNRLCLIFKGVTEHTGKSRALGWLCPVEGYLKTGPIDTDNKDTRIALATNFLWNDDELKVFRAYDINKIKALISTDIINERLPFARSSETLKRLCSFAGSTNEEELLPFSEGNTRFLVVELLPEKLINWDAYNKIDKHFFWGEIIALHRGGYLESNRIEMKSKRDTVNESITITSSIEEVVMSKLECSPIAKKRTVMQLNEIIELIDSEGKLKGYSKELQIRAVITKRFGVRMNGYTADGERSKGYPVQLKQ